MSESIEGTQSSGEPRLTAPKRRRTGTNFAAVTSPPDMSSIGLPAPAQPTAPAVPVSVPEETQAVPQVAVPATVTPSAAAQYPAQPQERQPFTPPQTIQRATPQSVQAAPTRVKRTISLDAGLSQRLNNTYAAAANTYGTPRISNFIEQLLERAISEVEAELNGGQPFPDVGHMLMPTGRPPRQ